MSNLQLHTNGATADHLPALVPTELPTPVRGLLTLNPGHVSQATDQWLRLAEAKSLAWVSATPNGWFVWAQGADSSGIYPADLLACLRHAEALGCEFVLFDSEAPRTAELPFFMSRDGVWRNAPI